MKSEMDDGKRFDEPRVRQILRRAIEIDEFTARTMDAVELREIAAAVGISADALDQALDEGRQAEKVRRRRLKTLRGIRRVMGIATSIVLGLTSRLLSVLAGADGQTARFLTGVVPVAAIVLILAFYNRSRGDQRTYQIDNAGIWAGFVLASLSLTNNIPSMYFPGILACAVLAVLGFLIIGRKRSEPPGLSREEVLNQVVKSVADRVARDGPIERTDISARRGVPGDPFRGTLPATP